MEKYFTVRFFLTVSASKTPILKENMAKNFFCRVIMTRLLRNFPRLSVQTLMILHYLEAVVEHGLIVQNDYKGSYAT